MKIINIFLGGGVTLLEGDGLQRMGYRKSVVDQQISSINSQMDVYGKLFVVKTYNDLTHEVVAGGQQKCYNAFVRGKADIAVFILDGNIGDKTSEELSNALYSFEKNGHPLIFVYGTNLSDDDSIVHELNCRNLYYQHFGSTNELSTKLRHDLLSTDCSKSMVRQRRRENRVERIKKQFSNEVLKQHRKATGFRGESNNYSKFLARVSTLFLTWILPLIVGSVLYLGKVNASSYNDDWNVDFSSRILPRTAHFFYYATKSGTVLLYVLLSVFLIWGIILICSADSIKGKILTGIFELLSFFIIFYLVWLIFITTGIN